MRIEREISELYRVFQPYRLGTDFTGCSHCVSAAESHRLAAIPLQELTSIDIAVYSFKSMTTWGTARHFKHFLPRLFELAWNDFLSLDFPEVLFGKLAYAKWSSWPAIERDAVSNYLHSFWRRQLHSPGEFPTDDRIGSVIGALAEAGDSISPFLATWAQQQATTPSLHLSQFIQDQAEEVVQGGRCRLWGNRNSLVEELERWLASDEPLRILHSFRDEILPIFPSVLVQIEAMKKGLCTK